MMSSSTMYTSLVAIDWGLEHLEQCGWYLDCPKNKTSIIEIVFWDQLKPRVLNVLHVVVKQVTKTKPIVTRKDHSDLPLTRKDKHKAQPLECEAIDHLVGDSALDLKTINIPNPRSNVLFHVASFALEWLHSKVDQKQ